MGECVCKPGLVALAATICLGATGCRDGDSTRLAWGGDEACVATYRIDAQGDPTRRVELALQGPDPVVAGRQRWRARMRSGDGRRVTRRVWSTPVAWGPASPDAPCRTSPVDPLEHALAVGWPSLPDASVAVGDTWVGRKAGGICNALAAADGEATAGTWTHRLVALHASGGVLVAEVETEFAGAGTATARIDVGAGRLLEARVRLEPPARPGRDDVERPAPWVTTVKFERCDAAVAAR